MVCLRCGRCCECCEVIIVSNPDLGIVSGNIEMKPRNSRCKHLLGDRVGEYKCAVHKYSWYKNTPCNEYTQIVNHVLDFCITGVQVYKSLGIPIPKIEGSSEVSIPNIPQVNISNTKDCQKATWDDWKKYLDHITEALTNYAYRNS